jgi:hypothetical protein
LLGTDRNALINTLWLPSFYLSSSNYGEQQETKSPSFGQFKKKTRLKGVDVCFQQNAWMAEEVNMQWLTVDFT